MAAGSGGEMWKQNSGDCVRATKTIKNREGGLKQKGGGSHTLGNGVSDGRTFLGDICEESKRIIFLFPPLQRYLLWHIAVRSYRTYMDV